MTAARTRSSFIDHAVAGYAVTHSSQPDAVELDLQLVTRQRTGQLAGMQIGDDQAVFMEILVRSIGATRAVEVGTFTGYSALAVARGLGPDGRLLCCDISEEWTAIAREYWEKAGVSERIELRIGPALDTLRSLPSGELFDFAFVDADKPSYPDYYEEIIPRLRRGGVLLADNTLWSGRVATDEHDESTDAMRAFNDHVAADPRVRVAMLTIGDGVTVVQRVAS